MTTITFYKKRDITIGFEVSGHTGKASYGEDLLCCQISTIAQLAVVGVEKLNANVIISDGYLKVMISENDAKIEKYQFMFETCLKSFKSVILDEEKFAKLEVKNV